MASESKDSNPSDGEADDAPIYFLDLSMPSCMGETITRGYRIAEIFDLRLLEIHGKTSGLIYGTLEVVTGGGYIFIFDRPDMTCAQKISAKVRKRKNER